MGEGALRTFGAQPEHASCHRPIDLDPRNDEGFRGAGARGRRPEEIWDGAKEGM